MTTLHRPQIKINRALRAATIGDCPASAAAMMAAIPDEVVAALPARLIARLIDANWRLAGATRALAASDIVAEGAVWDAAQGRHREVLS